MKTELSAMHGGSTIAVQELLREASRVFRRLSKKGVYLTELNTIDQKGVFGVFSARSRGKKPSMKVEGKFVHEFLRSGWLKKEGEVFILSDDGWSWFRRSLSDEDAFLLQHQLRTSKSICLDSGSRKSVMVNEGESPLGWLLKRKDRNGKPLISPYHYEAGERLRHDFWRSHLMPSITANWSMIASSKRTRRSAPDAGGAITEGAIAAKKRVTAALASVGPELSGVLIDVCCHLQGLEDTEADHGWPQRSGKIVLQLALTRLARHYGLVSVDEISDPARSKILQWGTEDFRPLLDKWR